MVGNLYIMSMFYLELLFIYEVVLKEIEMEMKKYFFGVNGNDLGFGVEKKEEGEGGKEVIEDVNNCDIEVFVVEKLLSLGSE